MWKGLSGIRRKLLKSGGKTTQRVWGAIGEEGDSSLCAS